MKIETDKRVMNMSVIKKKEVTKRFLAKVYMGDNMKAILFIIYHTKLKS